MALKEGLSLSLRGDFCNYSGVKRELVSQRRNIRDSKEMSQIPILNTGGSGSARQRAPNCIDSSHESADDTDGARGLLCAEEVSTVW
jgi:hypothetical protein